MWTKEEARKLKEWLKKPQHLTASCPNLKLAQRKVVSDEGK